MIAEVEQHAPQEHVVFVTELAQNLGSRCNAALPNMVQHGFPQRTAAFDGALGNASDLSLVGSKAHTEHVGAHFATDPLSLELCREILEHLVRDLSERSAPATRGRQLRDEDRRLTNDGVNQLYGHASSAKLEGSSKPSL